MTAPKSYFFALRKNDIRKHHTNQTNNADKKRIPGDGAFEWREIE